ncbi:MAG: four helix bundle protein [Pseudomonadota bacterium]
MEIRCYRDLAVWREAMNLALECYQLASSFPKHERFGLANQLQRAAISVPANIAEGHAREHTRDFLRFLSIDQMQQTLNKADEVGRMLRGLQKALHAKLSTNNP